MKSNVVYLAPDFEPRKVTHPMAWVKQMFAKAKEAKTMADKKKISALLENTYNFYLDLYLTGVEQEKLVDIHPALYKAGYTTCSLAMQLAMEQMVIVIKENRVDECYRNLQEHLKNRGEDGKANNKRVIFGHWGAKKSSK